MRKALFMIILICMLILSSCSVQENMSPEIFFERLNKISPDIIYDNENNFIDKRRYLSYIKNKNSTEFLIEIATDEFNNAKKICLVCTATNKTDEFKIITENIINAYAPEDNASEIIGELFGIKWDYYDTQWYRYSSSSDKNCIFFSVESKKLSTESDAKLSLKQNDITQY